MPRRPAPSSTMIAEVRELICRLADRHTGSSRPPAGRPGSWDIDNLLVTGGGEKHDYLELLRAARLVAAAAETSAEVAAERARWQGADFAELGAVEGITRQAARQRHERARVRRTVRFVGGPRDGTTAVVLGFQREIQRGEWAGPWERGHSEYDDSFPAVTSVYRAKHGLPGVFEFLHLETSENGSVITEWERRPRVHQLARYWFTDSKIVLSEARAVGSVARSPSSRVELELLEPLRVALAARLETRLSSALPGRGPEDDG